MNWPALNEWLLECVDIKTLQSQLDEEVIKGSLYRVLRVYGRLSAVRRAQELKEIKFKMKRKRAV